MSFILDEKPKFSDSSQRTKLVLALFVGGIVFTIGLGFFFVKDSQRKGQDEAIEQIRTNNERLEHEKRMKNTTTIIDTFKSVED